MQILFINYGTYCQASGVHIHFLANELTKMGHECWVCLPWIEDKNHFGIPNYNITTYADLLDKIAEGRFSEQTLIHGWTPRESVRQLVLAISKALGAPWFVHLEDNERFLLEKAYKAPFADLLLAAKKGKFISSNGMIHPVLHQTFLAEAAGVTAIMDRLTEFVPKDVPTKTLWPACEQVFFTLPQRRSPRLRQQFGISENETVLVYPGSVHYANVPIVDEFYRALPLIEAQGYPISLIRCAGHEETERSPDIKRIFSSYIRNHTKIAPTKLPMFLRMADILVQPGLAGDFDDYRFPSKLPLFLASGRPVILPESNIGRFLTDEHNCLILRENAAQSIAEKVIRLIEEPELARKIGLAGRTFAQENFSWARSAAQLIEFYKESL